MLIYGLIVYSLKPRDAEPLPEQLPGDSRLQRIRSNRCYIFASMIGEDVGENFPQKSQLSTLRVGFPWLRLSECRQDWPESGCGHWKAQTPTMEETVDFGQIERSKEKSRPARRKDFAYHSRQCTRNLPFSWCRSYEHVFLLKLICHKCTKLTRNTTQAWQA